MRIISGKWKGHSLTSMTSNVTRPTSDKVRESIFNILATIEPHERVLDLFAGTGALGLEALSRGALSVTFVEHHRAALTVLKRNITQLSAIEQAHIYPGKVVSFLSKPPSDFSLIFVDPPYDTEGRLLHETLTLLGKYTFSNVTIVAEHLVKMSHPLAEVYGRLRRYDERTYGQTAISFYQNQDNIGKIK